MQAAGTTLSRLTGFGRVFALAYALGRTRLADTYWLANNTPNIIFELVIGGVLSGMVLPEFVRQLRNKDNEDDGWRAVSAVITVSAAACAALSIVFVVVAPWFIRLYTVRTHGDVSRDQLAVATTLLRLFAPQVFLYGLVYLSTALLRARRKFAAPMFAPVLNNVVVIALFLAWPTLVGTNSLDRVRHNPGALWLLGLGTTLGVAAMAVAQLPLRIVRDHIRPVWAPRHPSVVRIVRLGGWTAGFVAANQVALFVVFFLANGRAGDVSVYLLAYTIFLLPHGVVAVSILSAIQPELADRWAAHDLAGFRDYVSVGMRSILATIVPAAVGFVLLAGPLVTVMLEHGALHGKDASEIAQTLVMLSLGLPAFSAFLFLTSAYQAMQNTRALFWVYLVENAINIVTSIALYPTFGVKGLALSFSIAYTLATVVALVDLRRRAGGVDGSRMLASSARIAVASLAMAVAVALVLRPLHGALLRSGVGIGAGVTVYLLACRLFGVREAGELISLRRRSGQ